MGGGILSIPLLTLVIEGSKVQIPYIKMIAYISIISLSISSIYKYIKQGRKALWIPALLMVSGVVITSVLTNHYIHLSPLMFNIGYIIIIIIIMLLIIFKTKIPKFNIPLYLIPVIGLLIGFIGGTFGLSGGVLFIPTFTVLFSQKIKDAAISSVLCKISMAGGALITLSLQGALNIDPISATNWWLLSIIPVAIIAGYSGAIINKLLPSKYFKTIFLCILFLVLIKEIIVVALL